MLNEEKIRIMTGIAIYEKKANKDLSLVTQYFKGDYISSRLIRSFILYTLSSVICVGIWFLYHMEELLDSINLTALMDSAKEIVILYAVGLLIYLFITYIIYFRRYDAASKQMKGYQIKLRRLENKYDTFSWQKDSRR